MKPCPRCGGQMTDDISVSGGEKCFPLRCIQCGNREDPVILAHRTMQRGKPKKQDDEPEIDISRLSPLTPEFIAEVMRL